MLIVTVASGSGLMLLMRLDAVSSSAMNSAGLFAVSNVRWTLIGGLNWLEGMFDGVGGAVRVSLCVSFLARENGWGQRQNFPRGDIQLAWIASPLSLSFACETVKATHYIFRARAYSSKCCGSTNELMAWPLVNLTNFHLILICTPNRTHVVPIALLCTERARTKKWAVRVNS